MIKEDNKYSQMQKKQMNASTSNMAKVNHKDHNVNPDYWNILLGDIKKNPEDWEDKKALDFGCGCGRNVENLLGMTDWERVDGIDISENNIEFCKKYLRELGHVYEGKYSFYANNGINLEPLKDEEYDFVMATIVFQHICVHDIRVSLKTDIYRVLKPNGIFSFQMTFGEGLTPGKRAYHDNYYDAHGTNSICDTRVDDPQEVIDDLEKIGFKNISYEIRPSFSDDTSKEWIFFRCQK